MRFFATGSHTDRQRGQESCVRQRAFHPDVSLDPQLSSLLDSSSPFDSIQDDQDLQAKLELISAQFSSKIDQKAQDDVHNALVILLEWQTKKDAIDIENGLEDEEKDIGGRFSLAKQLEESKTQNRVLESKIERLKSSLQVQKKASELTSKLVGQAQIQINKQKEEIGQLKDENSKLSEDVKKLSDCMQNAISRIDEECKARAETNEKLATALALLKKEDGDSNQN